MTKGIIEVLECLCQHFLRLAMLCSRLNPKSCFLVTIPNLYHCSSICQQLLVWLLPRECHCLENQTTEIAAESGSGWPSQRQMLLLKLWATIFQASDRRHPVLTPASLILGACLRLSPVNTLADVLAGGHQSQLRSSLRISNVSV